MANLKQAVTVEQYLEAKLEPKALRHVLTALELRVAQRINDLGLVDPEKTNTVLAITGRVAELRDMIAGIARILPREAPEDGRR